MKLKWRYTFLITCGSILFSSSCMSQYIQPVKKGNRYALNLKGQAMEIDPQNGGRITSLKIDGVNFLTDSTVNDFNWGSTFWPSPQSDWRWPPPAEWDNQPYVARLEGAKLKMESAPDPKTGLAVTKIFSADRAGNFYTLEYIVTNHADSIRKVAPWEVTRVHTFGFAFFPMGKGELRGGLIPQTIIKEGICWFTYEQEKIPSQGDTQLYTDGSEGWFAEVNGENILIKKFPDIAWEALAPNEGEVELYANKTTPEKSYVEIEHQGAYKALEPGQSFSWNMQWFLRKLPRSIKATPENPRLIQYVRGIVK